MDNCEHSELLKIDLLSKNFFQFFSNVTSGSRNSKNIVQGDIKIF